jgi:uncharacterized protein
MLATWRIDPHQYPNGAQTDAHLIVERRLFSDIRTLSIATRSHGCFRSHFLAGCCCSRFSFRRWAWKDIVVKMATKPAKPAKKPVSKTPPTPVKTAKAAKPAAKIAPPKAAPPKPAARIVEKPAAKNSPAPKAKIPTPITKPVAKAETNGHAKPAAAPKVVVKPGQAKIDPAKPNPKSHSTLRVEAAIPLDKDLSAKNKQGLVKDRITLTAPDAYWLHVYWELSMQSVQRAEAALSQDWHGAKPIIRLCDVSSTDTTSTSEAIVRDVVIHGGCSHWYIDVAQPPKTYRADIGYLTRTGRFFAIARSNVLTSPKAGSSEALQDGLPGDPNKKPDDEAARYLNEEAFRRPLKEATFGTGAVLPGKLKKFFFDLDAELIVYVKTDPSATVTLQNEPVKINPDGTATMRFSLPDSRQIIPAVATSGDGMEEQTIVLAVERNTKRLDPMIHDLYGEV